MPSLEKGAKTAVEMRGDFNQEAESLPPFLQKFIDKMLHIEITDLEQEVTDLSPTTVNLFKAIELRIAASQEILVEKLTADSNMEAFTVGTKKGIAEDMPAEMIPLVISALAKLARISKNAHQEYELMKSQLPQMLIQLREALNMQAALAQEDEIKTLKKEKVTLESVRPVIATATADLDHDGAQQGSVKQKTSWLEIRVKLIDRKTREKKLALQKFMRENFFFETGASLLAQPL